MRVRRRARSAPRRGRRPIPGTSRPLRFRDRRSRSRSRRSPHRRAEAPSSRSALRPAGRERTRRRAPSFRARRPRSAPCLPAGNGEVDSRGRHARLSVETFRPVGDTVGHDRPLERRARVAGADRATSRLVTAVDDLRHAGDEPPRPGARPPSGLVTSSRRSRHGTPMASREACDDAVSVRPPASPPRGPQAMENTRSHKPHRVCTPFIEAEPTTARRLVRAPGSWPNRPRKAD